MSHVVLGSCSRCGGSVTVPQAWWATVPPVPTCSQCGAVKRAASGPIIEMEPSPKRIERFTSTDWAVTTKG